MSADRRLDVSLPTYGELWKQRALNTAVVRNTLDSLGIDLDIFERAYDAVRGGRNNGRGEKIPTAEEREAVEAFQEHADLHQLQADLGITRQQAPLVVTRVVRQQARERKAAR